MSKIQDITSNDAGDPQARKTISIEVDIDEARSLLGMKLELQKELLIEIKELQQKYLEAEKFITNLRKLIGGQEGGYDVNWSWEEKCKYILATNPSAALTSRQISEEISKYEPYLKTPSVVSSVSATLSVKSVEGVFKKELSIDGESYYFLPKTEQPESAFVPRTRRFRRKNK